MTRMPPHGEAFPPAAGAFMAGPAIGLRATDTAPGTAEARRCRSAPSGKEPAIGLVASTFAVYAASATAFSRRAASFLAPRPRSSIFETSILTESRRSVASMSANEGSDLEAYHGQ